jgi:lipopolysaccharide export system protein LptA
VNFLKGWLLALFLLCEGAVGAVDSLEIAADSVSGNAAAVQLIGNVAVNHPFGLLKADEAVLTIAATAEGQRSMPSSVLLSHHVVISLQTGGILTCGKAKFDFERLKGRFNSDVATPWVCYQEKRCDKLQREIPMRLQSRSMEMRAAKLQLPAGGFALAEMAAEGEVSLDYGDDFYLTADRGLYRQSPEAGGSRPGGEITLSMSTAEGRCAAKRRNGDTLTAKEIVVDTVQQRLHLAGPSGQIAALSPTGGNLSTLRVVADRMIWEENRDLLTLTGNVTIEQPGVQTLEVVDKVRFYRSPGEGHRQLRAVESFGLTTLTQQDLPGRGPRTVTCTGKSLIDHQKGVITMSSAKGGNGTIAKGTQVHLSDADGEIYANQLTLHYRQVDGHPLVTKMLLSGNVSLVNRQSMGGGAKGAIVRYATADFVTYIPDRRELSLYAKKSGRILFCDKANSLQVSAPGLVVTRDPLTNKDSIKGIGDVRMSLMESELAQLREQLELYMMPQESAKAQQPTAIKR